MDLLAMIDGCKRDESASWEAFLPWFSRVSRHVLAGFPKLHLLEREEVADEARRKVWAEIRAGRFQATYPGEVVNFVRVVVRREALDLLRSRNVHRELSPALPEQNVLPAARAELRVRVDCLQALLITWSEQDRFIFMMKLNAVPAATIRDELAQYFGVHVEPETIDVRFVRLRRNALKACA
jgi:DNA-directed RNA polymerase specialized sigma24 family protein